jgi:hypothetical protein
VSHLSALAISEKEWEAQLIGTEGKPGLARQLGWHYCYHTLRSKGSASGFPDWVLSRERVIYLELKREEGKVTSAQADWIRALHKAGAEVYVVRPRHLEEIAKVLQRVHRPWQSDIPAAVMWQHNVPSLNGELESILQGE